MIGVAFALRDTFGSSDDIAETAFARVLGKYANTRRIAVDVTDAYKTVVARTPIDSPSSLATIAATVLGPDYRPDDDRTLEAYFRMEAARLVATRFVPHDDVAPTLADLARLNIPLAALGDGWPSIDERKAQAVGFAGEIVHAADVGADGDVRRALAEIVRRLRVPAENVWFVGSDFARDIAPAAAAGARTILVDYDGAGVPDGAAAPDATVRTFAAIRDVLGEPYTRGLLALRYIMRTSLDWRPGFTIATEDALGPDDAGRDG